MKLKKLLLLTALSTSTLFGSFQNVSCDPEDGYLETLRISEGDCRAMEAFWDATGHETWTNQVEGRELWDRNVSAEDWYGIVLHPEGGVDSFVVDDNNLTGEIPNNADTFDKLEVYSVTGNHLTGSLPKFTHLKDISNFRSIYFYDNNFTGTLPSEWNRLINLIRIYAYNNQLSEALPDLSSLVLLYDFEIFYNNFHFSDIEPQIHWLNNLPNRARYSPQGLVRDETIYFDVCKHHYIDESNRVVYFNKTLSIEPSVDINPSGNDYFTWYKGQNTRIGDSGDRIYSKDNATMSDEGYYYYRAYNTIVTEGEYIKDLTYLHLCGTQGEEGIHAIHDNAPAVTNTNPTLTITEGETYTYDANISDEDGDVLKVTASNLPDWLTFTSTNSNFTLTGTAVLGQYDINITVVDLDAARSNAEKIPVHINYTLSVNPSDNSLPDGFSFENNVYSHTDTNNTLSGEGQIAIVNNGLKLTQSCENDKMPYITLASDGELSTGFTDCNGTNPSNTFESTLPNNTDASIVTNNEKMILIELPLGDDMTLGGK